MNFCMEAMEEQKPKNTIHAVDRLTVPVSIDTFYIFKTKPEQSVLTYDSTLETH